VWKRGTLVCKNELIEEFTIESEGTKLDAVNNW
jgi:hypothetical protein